MSQPAQIGVPSPRPYEPPVPGPPMSDIEWQACEDPQLMLSAICGRITDRTLRVFAIACARRVWHLFRDERAKRAIEATEEFVAGHITAEELAEIKATITEVPPPKERLPGDHGTFGAAWYASGWYSWYAACYGSQHAAKAVGDVACKAIISANQPLTGSAIDEATAALEREYNAERVEQAALLRELVGPNGESPDKLVDPNNTIYMRG